MPLPVIFFEDTESKFFLAAKNGDIETVRQCMDVATNEELESALVISFECGKCEIAKLLLNNQPSLFNLTANDLPVLIYPAIRARNIDLLLLLRSIDVFKEFLDNPDEHIVSMLQDILTSREEVALLKIICTLWPNAAAMKQPFPAKISEDQKLNQILESISISNIMNKKTNNPIPEDVMFLIFSFAGRMHTSKPAKITNDTTRNNEVATPTSILRSGLSRTTRDIRRRVTFSL